MNSKQFKQWCERYSQAADGSLQKPLIMGILNLTPDSFSDGGLYTGVNDAVARAHQMIAQGADLIDIGGESTRPGASVVSAREELARVLPVIKCLQAETEVCLSIDTSRPEVMQAAVAAGAGMINDIRALSTPEALSLAASLDVPVCLMHMQGEPATMQKHPYYKDELVTELNSFFQERIEACQHAGIRRENLILDPGFGFGKTVQHNLQLIKHFAGFKEHNLPLLLGVSRKSTLGILLDKPVEQRLNGGLALTLYAALQGMAIVRTHDVAATNDVLTILEEIHKT